MRYELLRFSLSRTKITANLSPPRDLCRLWTLQSTPGVVYINTFVNQRDAFTMNVLEVPTGTGSGFVWDDKGHIVTNFHVMRWVRRGPLLHRR